MRRLSIFAIAACLLSSIAAHAQSKPGLWQTDTTMTWQKAPLPPDVLKEQEAMPNSPFNSATKIRTRSCVTQEIIDKFGAPAPQLQTGCILTNLKKSDKQTSADMACQGKVTGSGNFKVDRPDGDHNETYVHFAGSMENIDAEWTMHATSSFVGAGCGDLEAGKSEVVH